MMKPQRNFNYLIYLITVWLYLSPLSGSYAQLGKRSAKDYIAVLESPDRLAKLKPDEVVSRLNLRRGDVVADIGAGSGVFTGRLAQAVGSEGKVFAVDIDQELLDYNRGKIQEAKLQSVEFILGGFDDPKLPPQSVDLAFICDVVHHIEHRQVYLSNLRACVKPNGRVAIIDFKSNWPQGHESMKYSVDELLGWMKAAGFQKKEDIDLIPDALFLVFVPVERPAAQ